MSSGSGTVVAYSLEVRSDCSFVAWDLKGYECMLTPQAEFVIGSQWKTVPLTTVAEPYGIAHDGLIESDYFCRAHKLVSYKTALAIQAASFGDPSVRSG